MGTRLLARLVALGARADAGEDVWDEYLETITPVERVANAQHAGLASPPGDPAGPWMPHGASDPGTAPSRSLRQRTIPTWRTRDRGCAWVAFGAALCADLQRGDREVTALLTRLANYKF